MMHYMMNNYDAMIVVKLETKTDLRNRKKSYYQAEAISTHIIRKQKKLLTNYVHSSPNKTL